MIESHQTLGVKFPFTIAAGSVVTTSSPTEVVGSQVTFCMSTQAGERIMRPSWGINILQAMYEMEGESVATVVRTAVETMFRRWFPDLQVKSVKISTMSDDRTMVTVSVRYGAYDKASDAIATVGTPIPGGAELFRNEGLA